MSDNIDEPKIPFNMRLYYRIRDKFNPEYSLRYMIIESLVISLISTFLVIIVSQSIYIHIIATNIVYLLVIAGLLYSVDEDTYDTVNIMNFSRLKFGFILLIIISLLVTIFIFSGLPSSSYVVLFILVSYVTIISTRSNRYQGEREYYTNEKESSVNNKWIKASVMLEKANECISKNDFKSGFYWFKSAEKMYNNIVIAEDKPMLREGANTLSTACTFYSASIVSDNRKSLEYQRVAEELFQLAREKLSHRVCSQCGELKYIDNCKLIVEEKDNTYTVCTSCYSSKERSKKTKGWKNTSRHRSERSKQQKYESGQITKSKYDDMSVDEATDTLNIRKPITEEKINTKFRKKVKTSHPDTGGSEEEFKKVKKSKEILLDHIH